MRVAIMQPYLFPYLGYFQLIAASDRFVAYDDVQYIRRGWINRNYIIVNKRKFLFVLSVKHDAQSTNINEMLYSDTFALEVKKLFKSIDQAYSKAPYYPAARALLADVLGTSERNVAEVNIASLRKICAYLGITTEILVASDIDIDQSLTAEDRIIAINKILGSTRYINPIGGVELYSAAKFRDNELVLSFLKPKLSAYMQPIEEFVPGLSIVDVLMNCSPELIHQLLADYELL